MHTRAQVVGLRTREAPLRTVMLLAAHRGQQHSRAKGYADHGHRTFLVIVLPIRHRLDLALQFLKIRAEIFAGVFDMILYLVRCFTHSTFSFTFSTVRSGVGCTCLIRFMPALSIKPA